MNTAQKKRHVLLARPSIFIVNEMGPFVTQSGYNPRGIKNLAHLDKIPDDALGGAVISTAINSVVPEGYEEVVVLMRRKYPTLPIALATLVDFEHIYKALRLKLCERNNVVEDFIDIGNVSPTTQLDPAKQMLVIHKKHIDTDINRAKASQILKNFFR
jgi:hypothetical protein